MKTSSIVFASLSLFAYGLNAASIPSERLRTSETRGASCTNGPTSRQCWSNGFDIGTDFDLKWPTTGRTVTYNFEITNTTCNPDGHGSRICLLINGQYPGPTIRANWGDHVVVNVKNSMQDNGTSIHWHGVRQLNTPGMDGAPGLTQCPIAPGSSMTYNFQATQYGTSWYHSHFTSQYGDGVFGPIIFDGPATANYDVDLGAYTINEWYYRTAFQMNALFGNAWQSDLPGPGADNTLINGTNKNLGGGGQYSKVIITKGKLYRLRLVCTSVDNFFHVSLDNHNFQIITSDFVPIKPVTVDWLLMGPGQRYDVIINANQLATSYWFRAQVAGGCLSSNNGPGLAIFSYNGSSGIPTSYRPFPAPADCNEPSNLVPYWSQPVPNATFSSAVKDLVIDRTTAQVVPGQDAVFVWALNYSAINVAWEYPTLSYVMNGNTSYPTDLNIIPAASMGSWNYWLIQQSSVPALPHPIHLHGGDFFILGSGSGNFSNSSSLNFATPTRRDTVTLPGGGWVALAFQSDNPGAWLMHCHIAWHISEGLGVQFLEAPSKIQLPERLSYGAQCQSWNKYSATSYYKKIDSGL